MSKQITFDNPSYPLWKAGYDAGYTKGQEDMREMIAKDWDGCVYGPISNIGEAIRFFSPLPITEGEQG